MGSSRSALESWSPEEVARARRWVRTWQDAAPRLDEIRRRELRALDTFTATLDWPYIQTQLAPLAEAR